MIDEAVNTGKGANSIISMLHHYLEHHSLGEADLTLYADNCSGQNKNRYVMQYLAWRVMTGLNNHITVSFLIVGHTKFAPDWCFGLLKRAFRRTRVGCLDDIVRVVEESAEVNHAQLVGAQDGTVIVPTYDWAGYFDPYFKQAAFKGIKMLHHMRFSNTHHGKAFVKNSVDSQEKEISLLRNPAWHPDKKELPPIVPPPGLSLERRKYLYEKIREFCPPYCQDSVCPEPVDDSTPTPPTPKRKKHGD